MSTTWCKRPHRSSTALEHQQQLMEFLSHSPRAPEEPLQTMNPQLHADSVAQLATIIEKRYGPNPNWVTGLLNLWNESTHFVTCVIQSNSVGDVPIGKWGVRCCFRASDGDSPTGCRTGSLPSLPVRESGIIVIALRFDRTRPRHQWRRKWRPVRPPHAARGHSPLFTELGNAATVTLNCDMHYSSELTPITTCI